VLETSVWIIDFFDPRFYLAVTGVCYRLKDIIRATNLLGNVCSTWPYLIRSLALGGNGLIDDNLWLITTSTLGSLKAVLPFLRDCVLCLREPGNIKQLELTRSSLGFQNSIPLGFITAVSWDENPED
jgi:hypothetical protein